MKKIFAAIAIFGIIGLVPPSAEAKDLSKINVRFSAEINKDCGVPSGYDAVWGCYIFDSSTPLIYLNQYMPPALLPYVYLKNVGYHLTFNVPDAELGKYFHPFEKNLPLDQVAAGAFVVYALGGNLPQSQKDFFSARLAAP